MSRNIEQNQRVRDARREKILSHARRLFAIKGLAATKITDIAAAAQMSQGLLYHYFHSKEEIFVEIIRDSFEKMNTAACALEELSLPAGEKIRLALTQLLRNIEESEDFANTIMMIAQAGISDSTPLAAQSVIREESATPYLVVARIMRAGQQEGSIRSFDADELSLLFWTCIKGLALHKAVNSAMFTAPDVRILTNMFLAEISNKGESDE